MFCLKGNANLNKKKMMVDGGMKYGGEHIRMAEHENVIKDMKEKKSTNEIGLIDDYCLVCYMFDSICKLFGKTIRNMFKLWLLFCC